MAKMIAFDQEARDALRRGVSKLAQAVQGHAGPRGRNVILQKSFGSPTVTKDGVTVAKEIDLEDVYENMGARMVREVASKTSDVAGDGTTTATILAEAIFNEGLRAVVAGVNPVQLKQGMEKAVADITDKLKSMSISVKNKKEEIAQVGAVAANNDPEIGKLLADAMEKVGKDGVITVDEGKSLATEVEWVEGMQFDRGYLSPYFVTDPQKMECVLEDAYVLIYEKKLSNVKEMVPVLEKVVNAGKPLLIVAEDVDGEALATLVINKLRGTIKVARREGPRLRRPPQGDARGHRHPDRRHGAVREPRPEAGEHHAGRAGPGQEDRHRQGQHHDHRRRRQERRDQGPHRAVAPRDREHHQRLRPREARRAAGQAGRRRGQDQRRRRHRERDEGEEGPRRGRPARHPRGRRGRHPARRRRGPAAGGGRGQARRPAARTRRSATRSCSAPAAPR